MLIVDSQVHIWEASTPEHPWPTHGAAPHRPMPFTKDELLLEMDGAGAHRAVIVPTNVDGNRNDLGLKAARLHPDRFAVMGRLDIDAPGARSKIASWRQQPGMLGLRFTFKVDGYPADDWLWAEAEAAGIPITMAVSTAQLHSVDRAAERHPALKLMIDHLAVLGDKEDDKAFADLDALLALAQRPNVAVKASALPRISTENYPYRRLHPHLRRVYDAFGPKRMFWGTDFTRLSCSYRQAITMFTEEIPWFTSEDKEWIMGRGLCEWIGWKLP